MAGDSVEQVSVYRNVDVDESGDAGVLAAAKLVGYHIFNASAGSRYVKLYNTAGAPVVGTDTPLVTIGLGTLDSVSVLGMAPIYFSSGIGVGATTGAADGDTGAPGGNDIVLSLYYLDIG